VLDDSTAPHSTPPRDIKKGSTQNRKITKHICHQRLIDHAKRQRRRMTESDSDDFSSTEEDPEFDSEDDEE
jgi:hypothetical protein